MKVLYALQGTGNGHVARAREIVPILASRCDLDVLVAGTQSQIALEYPIRFKKFPCPSPIHRSTVAQLPASRTVHAQNAPTHRLALPNFGTNFQRATPRSRTARDRERAMWAYATPCHASWRASRVTSAWRTRISARSIVKTHFEWARLT